MESVTVLWPVRVWVSDQGFHVNVQGWEWETPVTGGQTLGLAHGITECPRGILRGRGKMHSQEPRRRLKPKEESGLRGHS